jgi:hypothetical protein
MNIDELIEKKILSLTKDRLAKHDFLWSNDRLREEDFLEEINYAIEKIKDFILDKDEPNINKLMFAVHRLCDSYASKELPHKHDLCHHNHKTSEQIDVPTCFPINVNSYELPWMNEMIRDVSCAVLAARKEIISN